MAFHARHSSSRFHIPAGFTLVELIVVISIIALLMAILLPALSAARGSANIVQCANHLRQLGVGIHVYANDHKDYTPPNRPNYGDHGGGPTGVSRGPGLLVGPPLNGNYGQSSYLTNREIFYCPTNPVAILRDDIPDNSNVWAYIIRQNFDYTGSNLSWIGYYWIYYPDRPTYRTRANDRVTHPGNRVYLYDFGIAPDSAGSINELPSHPGRAINSLYVGGHVKSLPLSEAQNAFASTGSQTGFVEFANSY